MGTMRHNGQRPSGNDTLHAVDQRVCAFVRAYQGLISEAQNEAEVRSYFDTAARTALGITDLRLEWGRQDIRRNRVIIECKDKGLFYGKRTSRAFKQALKQLTEGETGEGYIQQQARADGRDAADYTGVCFDGKHLAFVYLEAAGVRVSELRPFDVHSAAALVLALDQDERRELTAANVADDFGPESSIARALLSALYTHLDRSLGAHVNRVEMLFTEWRDLFEQGTNFGKLGQARLKQHLEVVGIPADADLTRVLFVLHTYHALFFKLLAAEVVLSNRVIPNVSGDYCFSTAALDDGRFVESLQHDIEESGLFRQVNVLNFVEGLFFSWYLVSPSLELLEAVRRLLRHLMLYRLSGIQLTRTRDIVKRVYQQLVPAVLRHNIGEYFTPEWLVEFTLDQVGYDGPEILERKFLDPCCGSGNFLIHVIARYKAQASAANWDGETTLRHIMDRVIGFDLNPLAVLTARVNYLIAIAEFIGSSSEVEIPVYLADAIYAPTRRTSGTTAEATRVYTIRTRRHDLKVELPESLVQRNRLFGRVMALMEESIRHHNTVETFLALLSGEPSYAGEPLRASWEPSLRDLFAEIEQLERDDWNRIWCRIIRNYYASVAVGECAYIAGNPPWVRWSELPKAYAEQVKETCRSYDIFSQDTYHGGNELDISAMITYTVADKWLATNGGRLSLVLPQQHFQSQSSGGFRRFEINGVPLGVWRVDDFTAVNPFTDVANKTAVMGMEKGRPTVYPVEYRRWKRQHPAAIPEDASWLEAEQFLAYETAEANALGDPGRRWCILPPGRYRDLQRLAGRDAYVEGRKGITTDANGAYFVRVLGPGSAAGTVQIENQPHAGKKPLAQVKGYIELEVLYPLIKGGAEIRAYHATPGGLFAVVPNQGILPRQIPTVSQFAQQYPQALRYFQRINASGALDERSTYKKFLLPNLEKLVLRGEMVSTDIPFYAIYDVGPYTFAPYKVVWAEMGGTFQAAVIADAEMPHGGGRKPIVPDHKVYFAAFSDADIAYYVCALLNSALVRLFVESFRIDIQTGTVFRHLSLPPYDAVNPDHSALVRYAREAHTIKAETGGEGTVEAQQSAIDTLAERVIEGTSAGSVQRPRVSVRGVTQARRPKNATVQLALPDTEG